MYSFKNDYSEGAHPKLLNALLESNFEQADGYGEDCYTQKAVELLKQKSGETTSIFTCSQGVRKRILSLSQLS